MHLSCTISQEKVIYLVKYEDRTHCSCDCHEGNFGCSVGITTFRGFQLVHCWKPWK